MSEDYLDFLDDMVEGLEDQSLVKNVDLSLRQEVNCEKNPVKNEELTVKNEEFFPVKDAPENISESSVVDKNYSDMLSAFGINREDYPKLVGDDYSDYPQPYRSISDGIILQYSRLPELNHGDIYNELSHLSVKSCSTPTLQVINDEIQKVQSAKDRLSEIYCDVLQNYHFKKRAVDILEAAWSKYTLEKNAEKRKGDALFRISEFSIDFAKVESLAKVCQHILRNLDSLHESLSRRITVNQLLLKLNDIGRGSLPVPDFNDRPIGNLVNESFGLSEDESEKDDQELNEENF